MNPRVCDWHQWGVPLYAQGKNWMDRRCPVCLRKLGRRQGHSRGRHAEGTEPRTYAPRAGLLDARA